jgi:hypothetical protein
MRPVLFALILSLIGVNAADAACPCLCVDGRFVPVCDGDTIDRPKVCPPTVCPIPKPSVAPVIPPGLRGLGPSQCRQAQVCDTSGKCAWEEVCR